VVGGMEMAIPGFVKTVINGSMKMISKPKILETITAKCDDKFEAL
jgi:hypothetical protein